MRRLLALPCALAAAVVLLAGCGGGDGGSSNGSSSTPSSTPAGAAASGSVVVDMKDIQFAPKDVTVKAGQTIAWRNQDAVAHNVTADSGATFKSSTFGKGGTFSFKAAKAGTIKYECTIHPGMTGTITVQ
jgi:plastocyanin